MSVPETEESNQLSDMLREVITEFSTECFLKQPSNLIDFAAEYFAKLQQKQRQQYDSKRNENEISSPGDDSIMDEEPMIPARISKRRMAIFVEKPINIKFK